MGIVMNEFDVILDRYIKRIESPDGRDTYESLSPLVERIIKNAKINPTDSVIDMGSGWGNVSIQLSKLAHFVVGIEPNKKKLKEAQKRIERKNIDKVEFIKGSFETPHYKQQVDKIISSLVFHQMNFNHKKKALSKVKKHTPENSQFYCIQELLDLLQELEMQITNIDEICPFFGIISIVNK